MNYQLFSIRDLKGEFSTPMIEQSEAAARRQLAMAVNTNGSILSFSPSDFELYRVGEFVGEKGIILSLDLPEFVCRADELVGGYK